MLLTVQGYSPWLIKKLTGEEWPWVGPSVGMSKKVFGFRVSPFIASAPPINVITAKFSLMTLDPPPVNVNWKGCSSGMNNL